MKSIYFLILFFSVFACENSAASKKRSPSVKKDKLIAVISQYMTVAPHFDGFAINSAGDFIAASGFNNKSVYQFSDKSSNKVIANNLSGPVHILINKKEETLVTNFGDGSIDILYGNDSTKTFVTGLNAPVGMAEDEDGNIYVANYGVNYNGNSISKVSKDGVRTTFITDNQINGPIDVAYATDKNIYIANFNDGILLKVENGKANIFAELPKKRINHMIFFKGYFYMTCSIDDIVYRSSISGGLEVFAGGDSELTKKKDDTVLGFSKINGISSDGENLFISNGSGKIWKIEFIK